jgi:hypothetical protein
MTHYGSEGMAVISVIRIVIAAAMMSLAARQAAAQLASVGVGAAAISEQSDMPHSPLVASARIAVVARLIVETEWMSQTRSDDFVDSGPSRIQQGRALARSISGPRDENWPPVRSALPFAPCASSIRSPSSSPGRSRT